MEYSLIDIEEFFKDSIYQGVSPKEIKCNLIEFFPRDLLIIAAGLEKMSACLKHVDTEKIADIAITRYFNALLC